MNKANGGYHILDMSDFPAITKTGVVMEDPCVVEVKEAFDELDKPVMIHGLKYVDDEDIIHVIPDTFIDRSQWIEDDELYVMPLYIHIAEDSVSQLIVTVSTNTISYAIVEAQTGGGSGSYDGSKLIADYDSFSDDNYNITLSSGHSLFYINLEHLLDYVTKEVLDTADIFDYVGVFTSFNITYNNKSAAFNGIIPLNAQSTPVIALRNSQGTVIGKATIRFQISTWTTPPTAFFEIDVVPDVIEPPVVEWVDDALAPSNYTFPVTGNAISNLNVAPATYFENGWDDYNKINLGQVEYLHFNKIIFNDGRHSAYFEGESGDLTLRVAPLNAKYDEYIETVTVTANANSTNDHPAAEQFAIWACIESGTPNEVHVYWAPVGL